MLAWVSRLPAGDDLRILIGGIFPGDVTDVDQAEPAVGQGQARTVRPDFTLTGANAVAMVEVCRRLATVIPLTWVS